jgi:hypothetical protein
VNLPQVEENLLRNVPILNFSSWMDNVPTYSVCCKAGKINNPRKTLKFAAPAEQDKEDALLENLGPER